MLRGWNVTGAGEPVIPGVSIGHNEQGAWGLTIFGTDGEDLYVYDLNPQNLMQYKYRDKWLDMKEIKETIAVKDSAIEEVSLRYTQHGPVTFIDSVNHKGYAVKCAWLEPGGAPYLASLRMNQAKTWKDFRNACKYSNIPGENMVWADKKGNIGWQVVGIAPIRKNFSGMLPVPGDGRYEWSGYRNIKKRPNLLNPGKGFLATANQNVTPASYRHWNSIGYSWADPFRGNRINKVLSGDKSVTMEETKSLQTDYFSIPAHILVPMLGNIHFTGDLPAKAKAELMNWNFVLDKKSVAAGIYAMWERKLMSEANKQFVPQELKGLITIQLTKLIGWLQTPGARFGADATKGRDSFLQETFNQAVKDLTSKLGGSLANWTYGQAKYKHTAFNNPLHEILPYRLKEKFSLGPLPRGGNSYTPNSTGSTDLQISGASFRIIADLEDWDKTVMINTPGQSSDPNSKYYDNLFQLWATDQYFPAYFSRHKIESSADMITTLKPLD